LLFAKNCTIHQSLPDKRYLLLFFGPANKDGLVSA
jgi:hypothetical protein